MRYSLLLAAGLLTYAGLYTVRATAQEPADRIIFPHILHVEEMSMECSECHEGMETSQEVTHALLPVMDACLACHDGDTASEECDICHTQPDEADTYTWQPTSGLIFPHSTHITAGVDCSRCHPQSAAAEALAPRMPPTMNVCMDCHATPLSDAGCQACHASLDGKLPASHGADWPQTHGMYIHGSTGDDCTVCHQQTDCESCHAQAQLEKKVHPVNYDFLHAGDFMGLEKECSTCHAMPQECMSCHLARGIMPLSHNSPAWVNLLDGGFHHEEALDKPDYCVVCHEPASDHTCQRCHG
ncbi:MAG: cytochrome c3 family protein, partial [Fidelibacterota bacterium]